MHISSAVYWISIWNPNFGCLTKHHPVKIGQRTSPSEHHPVKIANKTSNLPATSGKGEGPSTASCLLNKICKPKSTVYQREFANILIISLLCSHKDTMRTSQANARRRATTDGELRERDCQCEVAPLAFWRFLQIRHIGIGALFR